MLQIESNVRGRRGAHRANRDTRDERIRNDLGPHRHPVVTAAATHLANRQHDETRRESHHVAKIEDLSGREVKFHRREPLSRVWTAVARERSQLPEEEAWSEWSSDRESSRHALIAGPFFGHWVSRLSGASGATSPTSRPPGASYCLPTRTRQRCASCATIGMSCFNEHACQADDFADCTLDGVTVAGTCDAERDIAIRSSGSLTA